jgi:CrcB protein
MGGPTILDAWARVLVLSIGGALGVNARYWLGVWMTRWTGRRFPWETVTINVSGSFAIGVLAVILADRWPNPLARLFLVTGFLGGYTTFSAFAFESLTLWERGEKGASVGNVVGSVVAGLVAVVLGVALGRALIGVRADQDRTIVERPDSVELPPGASPGGEKQDG